MWCLTLNSTHEWKLRVFETSANGKHSNVRKLPCLIADKGGKRYLRNAASHLPYYKTSRNKDSRVHRPALMSSNQYSTLRSAVVISGPVVTSGEWKQGGWAGRARNILDVITPKEWTGRDVLRVQGTAEVDEIFLARKKEPLRKTKS